MNSLELAPEFNIEKWLNTEEPLSLSALRGKVILVAAFQMLCPGCVEHCLPQAKRVYETFSHEDLVVIGLHTVFEHHAAMGELSLEAFLYEYRIKFPVAIDAPGKDGPIPKTMESYAMQGTPTILLIDKQGYLHKQVFGRVPDLQLGAEIMALIMQEKMILDKDENVSQSIKICTPEGCR